MFAPSAHSLYFRVSGHRQCIIIALILPKSVANFLSTTPFCCGVSAAVYSNRVLKPLLIMARSSSLFSPALSHLIVCTSIPSTFFMLMKNSNPFSFRLFFVPRNRLQHISVASSTINAQYFAPPVLTSLTELISRYIRCPLVVLFSSLVLLTFFCRAFASAQSTHASARPVPLNPSFFAVALVRSGPG